MKHPMIVAALTAILAGVIALPAEAGPSGPSGISGMQPTPTASKTDYHKCLGRELYLSLTQGPYLPNLLDELKSIESYCSKIYG